jgi:glycosyltransferase involved in cell wall biosynthesis
LVVWPGGAILRTLYGEARSVLLPGVEDFGIVPVEAQACGRPVVALGLGGAIETVVDGQTGVLVHESTAEAFAEGLRQVDRLALDPAVIRANAERFSKARFVEGLLSQADALMAAPEEQARW